VLNCRIRLARLGAWAPSACSWAGEGSLPTLSTHSKRTKQRTHSGCRSLAIHRGSTVCAAPLSQFFETAVACVLLGPPPAAVGSREGLRRRRRQRQRLFIYQAAVTSPTLPRVRDRDMSATALRVKRLPQPTHPLTHVRDMAAAACLSPGRTSCGDAGRRQWARVQRQPVPEARGRHSGSHRERRRHGEGTHMRGW
jgi:hypothetical protein